MLEIINKIKKSEAEADSAKRQAVQQSLSIAAKAQSDGKQLILNKKAEAQLRAEEMIQSAETAASELVKAKAAEAAVKCEALTNTANSRLDKAAELIVGRIVGSV